MTKQSVDKRKLGENETAYQITKPIKYVKMIVTFFTQV
jgi:hypothetical protein